MSIQLTESHQLNYDNAPYYIFQVSFSCHVFELWH